MKKTISLLLSLIMFILPICSCFAAYAEDTGVQIKNFRVTHDYSWQYSLEWDTVGDYTYDDEFEVQWSLNGGDFAQCDNYWNLTIRSGIKYQFRVRLNKYDWETNTYQYGEWAECSFDTSADTPVLSFTSNSTGFDYNIETEYPSDKYELYKYNKNTKKYELFKTLLYEYDNSLKSSEMETYKVRGKSTIDGKTYYTNYSNKITARSSYKTAATLNSVKSNNVGKVTVKWDKCTKEGCSGYEIQYTSEADFSYDGLTEVIKNVKTVSKTLSLVEGLTYKVRVRPYFTKTGGIVYGAWSSTKSVCVKSGIGGTVDAKKLINGQKLKKTKANDNRLDKILDKILEKYTNKNMSTYEKLLACYKYVSNEKFSNYGITGSNDMWWGEGYSLLDILALDLLDTKEGECNNYNALFCLLAKKIGIQDVRFVNGVVTNTKGGFTGHYWCVFKMNGHFYIFDPRLEMHNIKRGGNKNGTIYFCVPISDKNKTAQKYRFSLASSYYDFNNEYALPGYESNFTGLDTPKLSDVSNTDKGVQITWGKVSDAEKYRVFYKANGEKSWHKAGDTTSTSYTWKNAKKGTKYSFTVRCISSDGKTYTSDYNKTGKSITYTPALATPKLSSVSNTTSGVKISWGKVSGAAKYRIFYKTGNGGWKKLADTTSTSYTWKKAKSGTKYSFTVRCISKDGKTYKSSYNNTGKSITYVAAPKVSSLSKTSSGIKISWGKISGAAKYRIFYKTANGKWKKLTDTTSTSYTWKGAKKGTKYSFTVRCISKDGKTYTSAYDSKGKSITK